jgi:hypothetical protein
LAVSLGEIRPSYFKEKSAFNIVLRVPFFNHQQWATLLKKAAKMPRFFQRITIKWFMEIA